MREEEGRPEKVRRGGVGGRVFATPADMQARVDGYFAMCAETERFPTVTGLVLHLGFRHRQALHKYENGEIGIEDGLAAEFSEVVTAAKMRIEDAWTQRLAESKQALGPTVYMRNVFGWTGTDNAAQGNAALKVSMEITDQEAARRLVWILEKATREPKQLEDKSTEAKG